VCILYFIFYIFAETFIKKLKKKTMKKLPYFLSILFLSTLIISLGSCNKDDDSESFQTVLEKGGVFDDPMNSSTKSVTVDTVVNGDSLWACTTETYSVVQGMQEFPLFNPNSSVIYPGNMLQGGSLKNATPDVIVVDRAAGTFSIDILSGSWNISSTVNQVVKSEVVQALNDIVSDASYGAIPSNISFSMEEVHSEQQMALSLGLDFTAYGVALSSNLGFSSNNNYNRVLVRLSQSYYTMSFDLPASYDDLFAPTVTPDDLQPYVGAGNPACYISDVTYGRVFYLLVESTSNTSNITSSINASFSSIPNAPSANINASYLSSLENLNIKLFALGGDASTTLYTISSTNVNNLVSVLGAAGDITTGVPLSYVCRAVNGNKIVSVNLATSYNIENCAPIGPIIGEYGIVNPVLELSADDADS
jgi:thiol-activated cytolysin